MNSPFRIFHCDVKLNITNIGKPLIEKKLKVANVPDLIFNKSNNTIQVIEPPFLSYGSTFISSTLTISYKLQVDLSKTLYENNRWGSLFGYITSKLLKLFGKRSVIVGRQVCIQMAEGFKSKIGLLGKTIATFQSCTIYKINDKQRKVLLYIVENN